MSIVIRDLRLSDSAWEVPAHDITPIRPSLQNYAVVIPVINEGDRIRRQLADMHAHGIADHADIVIVDGGSTDGSLDLDFLASMNVHALIVKTGPGKLSAQLRCAYAYCLRQGYEGIVTIDGNDKDGVEAIADFVEAMRNGVDFVQGSRFIEGGKAINTPRLRWWAIRLLHAPMLSLGAGFWWTDTTNGFRAYSRRLLLDSRVQPFRDVFAGYELLPYLSVRGPRLGFVCKEMPVERRYPAQGKTPTKIAGWGSYARLLAVVFRAMFGRYNP
jgi:glycosyltransferase involved in cell wall biosynthesis